LPYDDAKSNYWLIKRPKPKTITDFVNQPIHFWFFDSHFHFSIDSLHYDYWCSRDIVYDGIHMLCCPKWLLVNTSTERQFENLLIHYLQVVSDFQVSTNIVHCIRTMSFGWTLGMPISNSSLMLSKVDISW